jgi:hypothetical protein
VTTIGSPFLYLILLTFQAPPGAPLRNGSTVIWSSSPGFKVLLDQPSRINPLGAPPSRFQSWFVRALEPVPARVRPAGQPRRDTHQGWWCSRFLTGDERDACGRRADHFAISRPSGGIATSPPPATPLAGLFPGWPDRRRLAAWQLQGMTNATAPMALVPSTATAANPPP